MTNCNRGQQRSSVQRACRACPCLQQPVRIIATQKMTACLDDSCLLILHLEKGAASTGCQKTLHGQRVLTLDRWLSLVGSQCSLVGFSVRDGRNHVCLPILLDDIDL